MLLATFTLLNISGCGGSKNTDTTAPAVPTVINQTTNDLTPVITGTAVVVTGETLTVAVSGATYTVVPDGSGNWSLDLGTAVPSSGNLAALSDGNTYEVIAKVTDTAGNSSTDSSSGELIIDTTAVAPTVTISEDADNDGVISGLELSGNIDVSVGLPPSAVAGDTITVTDGTTPIKIILTDAQISAKSVTTTFATPGDGNTITVSSTLTDAVLNVSAVATDSALVDTTAPAVPVVNSQTTTDLTPVITGKAILDSGDTLTVLVSDATYTIVPDGSESWSLDLGTAIPSSATLTALSVGNTYDVTAKVTDVAGNSSLDSSSGELIIEAPLVDTTAMAPTVTIIEDADNDGIISGLELSGDIDISIGLPTSAVVGNTITVTDGVTSTKIVLTDMQIAEKFVSITVTNPGDGNQLEVSATLTNAYNNVSAVATDKALVDSRLVEAHKTYFAGKAYEGTKSCLTCHQDIGDDVLKTGHWNWQGIASNLEGHEAEEHGKNDLVNNFCIAVPTNEGRCSQCHIGYDYVDKTYDFGNAEKIDCLICHDQTDTYKKAPTSAGNPDPSVDLLAVAKSVGEKDGIPQRLNCVVCHANAGGGDNVKHGDISTALKGTTREFDVHMGTDGENFSCVECHDVKKSPAGDQLSHGIGGMPFHSVDEGNMKQCSDCHGDTATVHEGKDVGKLFVSNSGKQRHERLACQVCHIPAIAKEISTKTDWDWSTAGQDIDPIPLSADGRPTYDKKKGDFVWEKNVRPVLRVHNGKWNKVMISVNDKYVTAPVQLSAPAADPSDLTAMIFPFKLMTGKQVADKNNKTMLVPHLFGIPGGVNPYWGKYDWDLAIRDGVAYTGQIYSGEYEFVDTEMLLTVNHEVASAGESFGKGGDCTACHDDGKVDWTALGWTDNPFKGGNNGPGTRTGGSQ